MKTADLIGAPLDYWVAQIERQTGVKIYISYKNGIPQCVNRGCGEEKWFCPSISWEQGGPIIERHGIETWPDSALDMKDPIPGVWYAALRGIEHPSGASTPLVAAMRVYVAHVYGDTVPDEVLA
ncbi:DUF2591 domain-containing protein [Collimonas pratensis]|uniref:phage protein NinX family protein n=1 Tax=Collimonas pratensis TaxID=279113 RepID=UPI00143DCC7D|nr:phage protein NinX family protein [Collimonas pratensis]NKI68944.1 DUF2591 domain-containing protein [Collimonas pratensis]